MTTTPVPSVACYLLVDRRGWVLLQERDGGAPSHPNQWCTPGGQVEPGESLLEAARREAMEETGVALSPDDLHPWVSERHLCPDCGPVDHAFFVSHVDLTDADVHCTEGRQIVFVDPSTYDDLDLTPSSRDFLQRFLASSAYQPARAAHRFGSVLLVDRTGAVLMQERDERPVLDPECWGLPGGHLEPGEFPEDGARRELEEETGVRWTGALVHWGDVPVHHEAYGTDDVVHVYAAGTTLTDADIDCHEGRQMVFVASDQLLDLRLTRSAGLVLPEFLDSPLHQSLKEHA